MDSELFGDYWQSEMEAIREHHRQMYDYFEKLLLDIPDSIPKKGDRVVVAAGLLNRGHLWIRKECTVIEVGDVSYKVRSDKEYDKWEEWVDRVLILDILTTP